jgi:carbon storage regulator CsrA
MLVLMRKTGESILIYPEDIPDNMTVAELFADGPIKITVTSTKGPQCQLGFDAPQELTIVRDEIYQKLKITNMEG